MFDILFLHFSFFFSWKRTTILTNQINRKVIFLNSHPDMNKAFASPQILLRSQKKSEVNKLIFICLTKGVAM